VDGVIGQLASSAAARGERVRYPGEQVLSTRRENLEKGIPVQPAVWEQVKAMK